MSGGLPMSGGLRVVQYVRLDGRRSLVTVTAEHEQQLRDEGRLVCIAVDEPGRTRGSLDRWIVEHGAEWERSR